jgi:Ser/Thr protein kinase RdoA (MazF antagonist)
MPGLLADLVARYDLPTLGDPVPMLGGFHNELLRLDDVVVRIEQREPASVAWEHSLLAFLNKEIPEVVSPLPALDGSTYFVHDGRVVSVCPFVEGTTARRGEGAEVIARIHRRGLEWQAGQRPGRPAYSELDWEHNDWWDWTIVAKPEGLQRAFARARSFIADAPPLVRGAIHGDPASQNLLEREGRIAGVIDWEYARIEWPALELASAAWSLAPDDPRRFVEEYMDAGGPGEPEILEEGARIWLLSNALHSLTCAAQGRAWNSGWVDHVLEQLRQLK